MVEREVQKEFEEVFGTYMGLQPIFLSSKLPCEAPTLSSFFVRLVSE